MKKYLLIFIMLISAVTFCFAENGENSNEKGKSKNEKSHQKTDIDLTKLNYNMATAVIYQILSDEDGKYLGKTIRMKGQYAYDDTIYGRFDYVLLFDATACCQTGFIFEDKSRRFPDDYPEPYDEIDIIGVISEKTVDGMDMVYIECGK